MHRCDSVNQHGDVVKGLVGDIGDRRMNADRCGVYRRSVQTVARCRGQCNGVAAAVFETYGLNFLVPNRWKTCFPHELAAECKEVAIAIAFDVQYVST